MRSRSLRRSLLIWLLGPLAVLLVSGLVGDYFMALKPSTKAYDSALSDSALTLANNIKLKDGKPALDWPPGAERIWRTDPYDFSYYLVRGPHNEFVAGEIGLPMPDPDDDADEEEGGPVYYDGVYKGARVRMVALAIKREGADFRVAVAETLVKRHMLIEKIIVGMFVPELVFCTAAVTLVWFGVGRGLKPFKRLRAEIAARTPRDLRPIAAEQVPLEVRPVVQALNELLQRLRESLSEQERFIADAAHQLRTPLAGLRLQVEVAAQHPGPPEWRHTLQQLQAATERAAHMVNRILTLARTEADSHRALAMKRVDLKDIVQAAAETWVPQAFRKDIDLGFKLESAWTVGEPTLIGEMLSNLIDNALRYTPPGGHVTVRSGYDTAQAGVLEVEDNGPGIPAAEQANVFKRFYRMPGTEGDGCGLGLAIVREIAQAHGAAVDIQTPNAGRGVRIAIRFQPVNSSATA